MSRVHACFCTDKDCATLGCRAFRHEWFAELEKANQAYYDDWKRKDREDMQRRVKEWRDKLHTS